jgi:hypothetical protein
MCLMKNIRKETCRNEKDCTGCPNTLCLTKTLPDNCTGCPVEDMCDYKEVAPSTI